MPVRAFGPTPTPPPQPQALPAAALWRPEQWRCHLFGLHWDGTQELLAPDVPVAGLEATTALSGTDTIRGTFTPEVPRLAGLVEPWATAVCVEFQGSIIGMCIVDDDPVQDAGLQFTSVGYFGYLAGLPYTADDQFIQADPLNIARRIWAHVQAQRFGNLGLAPDATTSPVRIGTDPKKVKFQTGQGQDVEFEAGPYILAWYQTDDLSQAFTQLASSTPFDFRETHTWNGPGSGDIAHRLQLGYPRMGRRQHELRFSVGENITAMPTVDTPGDDYASQVLVLGSGEGRKMLRQTVDTPYRPRAGQAWRRGRRVAVVDAKTLRSNRAVLDAARAEAARRGGNPDITQVTICDHPNAPFGSFAPGDDIRITGDDLPWVGDLGLWVRVKAITYKPDTGTADLSVESSERTNRDG